MAIDLEKLRWASQAPVLETVMYTDEFGNETEIAVTNKVEPSGQFKNTGALFEEPIPRANLNFMFDELYKAIQDLDARLSALEP